MKEPPDNGYTAVLAAAQRAMAEVLGNERVWQEERARVAVAPLPWPVSDSGKGYPQLLRGLVFWSVESMVLAQGEALGLLAPQPEVLSPTLQAELRQAVLSLDPGDPVVQLFLRVAKRAVDAADQVLRRDFAGQGRIDGKAAFKKWADSISVDAAVAAGHSGVETARAMGRSPETLYKRLRKQ